MLFDPLAGMRCKAWTVPESVNIPQGGTEYTKARSAAGLHRTEGGGGVKRQVQESPLPVPVVSTFKRIVSPEKYGVLSCNVF